MSDSSPDPQNLDTPKIFHVQIIHTLNRGLFMVHQIFFNKVSLTFDDAR